MGWRGSHGFEFFSANCSAIPTGGNHSRSSFSLFHAFPQAIHGQVKSLHTCIPSVAVSYLGEIGHSSLARFPNSSQRVPLKPDSLHLSPLSSSLSLEEILPMIRLVCLFNIILSIFRLTKLLNKSGAALGLGDIAVNETG